MKRESKITFITSLIFILLYGIFQLFFASSGKKDSILRIGFIYDGDESIPYTNNFIRSVHSLKEQYGEKINVIERKNVSPDKLDDVILEMANIKCEIIFTTNYSNAIITKEYAEKFPDIQFCQACGDNANEEPVLKNYHTFMGEIYQGRYACGVAAGLKLKEMIDNKIITEKEAKVGYVGAYPYPEVISGYTAFMLGVLSEVPSAKMTVCYTYTWSSFSEEKACANHLIDIGCKIISQHSDTIGTAVACEESFQKNVYHVGYNQSMIDIAPMTSLISTRINWTPYISGAVEAILNKRVIEKSIKGHVHGNDIGAGFDLGWIQILDINPIIAAKNTDEKVKKIVNSFKRGGINVFTGDYTCVSAYDDEDIYELKKGFKENEKSSYPAFHYILRDIITVEE